MPAMLVIAVLIVVGITGTLVTVSVVQNSARQQFNASVITQLQGISRDIKDDQADTESLAKSYELALRQSRTARADYQPWLKQVYDNIIRRDADLNMVAIALRVDGADRTAFEAARSAEFNKPFEITVSNDSGHVTREGERAEYYPIVFIEPEKTGSQYTGIDTASQPALNKAFKQSAEQERPVISGPLKTKVESAGAVSYAVVSPIVSSRDAGTDNPVPAASTIGFVLEYNSMTRLVEEAIGINSGVLNLMIFDDASANPDSPVVAAGEKTPSTSLSALLRNGNNYRRVFTFEGHKWTVVAVPDEQTSSLSFVILFAVTANIVFILLVGSYLFSSTRRTLVLENVESALRHSNSDLVLWADQAKTRTRELTLLSELSDMLQACDRESEAFLSISLFVPKMFEKMSGAIYLLDADHHTAENKMVWGESPPGIETFEFDECLGLRKGAAYQVDDVGHSLICEHIKEPKPAAYICIPMTAQSQPFGLFYLSVGLINDAPSAGNPLDHQISQETYELATTVAKNIALTLANIGLRERLKEQSITDPLTRLFNRRFMDDMLEREIKRAKRAQTDIGMIMMDIDLFKTVNDTYGHDAGDLVLRTLASFLKSSVRAEDIVCRYGGEEFLLILLGSSLENTLRRAESIRETAEAINHVYNGVDLGKITVSAGVAIYPEDGADRDSLVTAADSALYSAKRAGRNRVKSAHEVTRKKRAPKKEQD